MKLNIVINRLKDLKVDMEKFRDSGVWNYNPSYDDEYISQLTRAIEILQLEDEQSIK